MGHLHPHAVGAGIPDRQPVLRLEVRVRARAVHGRPPRLPRPRQGARRQQQHQRDDLPAWQPTRLRALGRGSRHGDVGLGPLPAVLQADGDLSRGRARRPLPRPRRAADRRARPGHEPALRGVLRGRPAGGLRAQRGRQRLPPGGLRAVRSQHPQGPAPERGAGLPAPGHGAQEPSRRDRRVRHEDPVPGEPRGRRRIHERRPATSRPGPAR